MNEREISQIRRRMRPQKNNIGRICGCYVNDKHAIISEFNQNLGLISSNEAEEILSVLRKTLSGSIGRNLIEVSFSNQQVLESEEHELLSTLRSSSLSDSDAVKKFFEKAVASIEIEGSYLLLLANDKYDIFTYNEFGEKNESPDVFSYIICAICPIKSSKPTLGYNVTENKFKNIIRDSLVSSPEIGFMFPTLSDNKANIYEALFYTRDVSESHETFTDAIFKSELPKPATEQTESIATILNSTIADECNLELVQVLQSQLIEITEDHKNNKVEEPLVITSKDIGSLLRCGGIGEETIDEFSKNFEEDFGSTAKIAPSNILNIKKFEVRTPEVTVKVAPEFSDFVETRVIDGTKYILIRADGDVEVNGIKININED